VTASDTAEVIAVVGEREITRARLEERMAALRAGPFARYGSPLDRAEGSILGRLVTRQLVTEEVLAIEAEAARLIEPSAARRSSPMAVSRILPSLIRRVTAHVTVPRSEIGAYYDRNRDRYRIEETRRVRHILLADEATARHVAARLRGGARFRSTAHRHSLDATSRRAGGDLGDVGRGVLPVPLEAAIFAAPIGTIIGPIETEHGWHVVRVDSTRAPGHARYVDVRASIESELLAAERERVFGDWLDRRCSALAVIAAEFAQPGDPVDGMPAHRH
jgi:hypothetical protein